VLGRVSCKFGRAERRAQLHIGTFAHSYGRTFAQWSAHSLALRVPMCGVRAQQAATSNRWPPLSLRLGGTRKWPLAGSRGSRVGEEAHQVAGRQVYVLAADEKLTSVCMAKRRAEHRPKQKQKRRTRNAGCLWLHKRHSLTDAHTDRQANTKLQGTAAAGRHNCGANLPANCVQGAKWPAEKPADHWPGRATRRLRRQEARKGEGEEEEEEEDATN